MEEIRIPLPKYCNLESITTKIEGENFIIMYEPKKEFKFGDYVCLTNRQINKGIISEIGLNGNVLFFNPFDEMKTHNWECTPDELRFATADEVSGIDAKIKELNYVVDYESQTIEPKRWRGDKGDYYWSISDTGKLVKIEELNEDEDDLRYKNRNYFFIESQAEAALLEIKAFLKHYTQKRL